MGLNALAFWLSWQTFTLSWAQGTWHASLFLPWATGDCFCFQFHGSSLTTGSYFQFSASHDPRAVSRISSGWLKGPCVDITVHFLLGAVGCQCACLCTYCFYCEFFTFFWCRGISFSFSWALLHCNLLNFLFHFYVFIVKGHQPLISLPESFPNRTSIPVSVWTLN